MLKVVQLCLLNSKHERQQDNPDQFCCESKAQQHSHALSWLTPPVTSPLIPTFPECTGEQLQTPNHSWHLIYGSRAASAATCPGGKWRSLRTELLFREWFMSWGAASTAPVPGLAPAVTSWCSHTAAQVSQLLPECVCCRNTRTGNAWDSKTNSKTQLGGLLFVWDFQSSVFHQENT